MIKKKLLPLVMIAILYVNTVVAGSPTSDYLQQSQTAMDAGNVYIALDLLQKAEQQINQPKKKALIRIALADALLRNGKITAAKAKLEAVFNAMNITEQPEIISEVMQRFGHIAVANKNNKDANNWYQQALELAQKSNDHAQIAVLLLDLSKITEVSLSPPQQSSDDYNASNKDLRALTRIDKNKQNKHQQNNKATTIQSDSAAPITTVELLQQANTHIQQLNPSVSQQQLLIALAHQAIKHQQVQMAQHALQTVLNQPLNHRLKSEALGQLGALYAQQSRTREALQLTEQALLSDNSPDLQLQWHWQRAKLLVTSEKKDEALLAYRSVTQQLDQLRIDIPVLYHHGQSSFNQIYAPLYTEFIELLLEKAAQTSGSQQQQLLEEVIQHWEQLKAVELQDYFRDACVVKQKDMIALDKGTAMLYPMLLSNHLALVVRFNDQIKAYSVSKSPKAIEAVVRKLHDNIYNLEPVLTWSKRLHQWLIAPITADLQQQKINTLVYLPDGILRKIPFAVLHDGQHYLAEQYALVTVPGLSMLAERSTSINKKGILLAGMSQAGPVVKELMNSDLDLFGSPAETRGLTSTLPLREVELTEDTMTIEQLRTSLALPGVSTELKKLSQLSDAPVIENNTFLSKQFAQHVHQGHAIVHIASHGFFSGNPKQSFIMTYDHLLNMQQLADLFQTEAFHKNPIEMVTLSACQTAKGDDRSPLGLSGVVIQMGVKSAIGSLWNVADQAAQQFFADFYRLYQQPDMSKAKAMQQAQKMLLKTTDMAHPFYWAPFILVGEWH